MTLQLGVGNDPFNKAMWDFWDSKTLDIVTAVALCLIELNVKIVELGILEENEAYLFPHDDIDYTPWEERFAEIITSTRKKIVPLSVRSTELFQLPMDKITDSEEVSWLEVNSDQVKIALEGIQRIRSEMNTIVSEILSIQLPNIKKNS